MSYSLPLRLLRSDVCCCSSGWDAHCNALPSSLSRLPNEMAIPWVTSLHIYCRLLHSLYLRGRRRWHSCYLFSIIAILIHPSGSLILNPILALIGYRLFDVVEVGGRPMIVLSKRRYLQKQTQIHLHSLSELHISRGGRRLTNEKFWRRKVSKPTADEAREVLVSLGASSSTVDTSETHALSSRGVHLMSLSDTGLIQQPL